MAFRPMWLLLAALVVLGSDVTRGDTSASVTPVQDADGNGVTETDVGEGHAGNDTHGEGHGNGTGGHEGHEGHEEHGVHVASWNFAYVSSPLVLSLFVLAVSILKLLFHYAECLANYIPESCVLIVFGVVVGAVLQFGLSEHAKETIISADDLALEPRMFMLLLLPPIVLDSAYSLNDRVFADNIGTILLYAVVGTVLNCFMIGPLLYGLCYSGVIGEITISFVQCLLFASFIVAVDPVAVLAIFQDIGVNDVLYFLVFGESLLNDAVTVVLYNMMKAFNDMDVVPIGQMLLGIASFFTVSLGGLSIGIIFGILTALFTRTTSMVRIVEPLVLLIMAYLSYLCAELVHWSGIISMIGCGIMQAQYAFHNIAEKSLTTVNYFVKMLSALSDAVIFLFLGLEVMRTNHKWHTGFVISALILCLICRLMTVFGLTWLCNRHGRVKIISLEEQFIMWYGGLRGAVCFALCATLNEKFEHKSLFLTTTLLIVFFTVFVQGITIKPLVGLLEISRKHKDESHSLAVEFQTNVSVHVTAGVEVIIGNQASNDFKDWIYHFNHKYLRHWLQNNPKTREEQFLEMYQMIAIKDHVNHIYEATATVVGVTTDKQFDGNEIPMLPMDDHTDEDFPRKKKGPPEKTLGTEEIVGILGKSYNANFSKGVDREIGGNANDIVAKLKMKHARLKENRRLRTPTTSPQGSLRRRRHRTNSENSVSIMGSIAGDMEHTYNHPHPHHPNHHPHLPHLDRVRTYSNSSNHSLPRRPHAPPATAPVRDHTMMNVEPDARPEAALAPTGRGGSPADLGRSDAGIANPAVDEDVPNNQQHRTVIAITDDSYATVVSGDGLSQTKC